MAHTRNDATSDVDGIIDWQSYLREGVIVELQIKRYRGVTTIDFSDLGLSSEFESSMSAYVGPGQKKLLPPALEGQLKTLETTARQNLRACSFPCDSIGIQGKFVPLMSYARFKDKNDALSESFYSIRDDISKNFDNVIDQVRADYDTLARRLYKKSHPDETDIDPEYVNSLVSAIVAQIPSKESVVSSFEYTTNLYRMPENILASLSSDGCLSKRVQSIPGTGGSGDPAERKSLDATRKQIERDIRASSCGHSDDAANDFIKGSAMILREIARDGSKQIIDSMKRNNGKLLGRPSMKAHSLIADLRRLDFYGDKELQEAVDWLEHELDGTGIRNVDRVRDAAEGMNEWARKSLLYLDDKAVSAPPSVSTMHKAFTRGSAPSAKTVRPSGKQAVQPAAAHAKYVDGKHDDATMKTASRKSKPESHAAEPNGRESSAQGKKHPVDQSRQHHVKRSEGTGKIQITVPKATSEGRSVKKRS